MLKELLKALWGIRDAINGKKENQSSDGKVFGFYFPDAIGALLEPENTNNEGEHEGFEPAEPSELGDTEIELTPVIFKNIDDIVEHYSEYEDRFHADEQTGFVFYPLYKNNNLEATECVFAIGLRENYGTVEMNPVVITEIPEEYSIKFKQDKFEGYYYLAVGFAENSEG